MQKLSAGKFNTRDDGTLPERMQPQGTSTLYAPRGPYLFAQCRLLADCVAKLFWASERERMIQGRQSRRNIDSNAHPPRFICFKMQFHRPFSATFATWGNSVPDTRARFRQPSPQ